MVSKTSKKNNATNVLRKSQHTKAETELKCLSYKTKEECDKYDCLWGKTGKCSKKRISKKSEQPTLVVIQPEQPKEVIKQLEQTKDVIKQPEQPKDVVKQLTGSSPNKELIRELQVLLNEAKLGTSPNDRFRAKSYRKAIEQISLLSTKIINESDIPLTKGGNIYLKVKEFLEKGNIGRTQEVLAVMGNALYLYQDLQKIAEVGPVKAKDLVEKHGIHSIDELKQRQELLNENQRIGLKYYETAELRIPSMEITEHDKIYQSIIKSNPSLNELTFSINGSYRRGMKDSGDIDILLSHPQNNMSCFRVFVDALFTQGYLIDTLAYGTKKYMGYGKLYDKDSIPRRIDIIYCAPNEYPFAQLYFTGSGVFNIKMREYATSKGYRLNERGIIDLKTKEFVKHRFEKEEDIFQYLGLSYVEPSKRIETYKFV